MIEAKIAAAAERRQGVLRQRVLDAWRILNGPSDRAPPGMTLDHYAGWLVLAARAEIGLERIEAWSRAARAVLNPRGIILKSLKRPVAASTCTLHSGEAPPEWLVVREEDARLGCVLGQGIGTGLFLDHRETRLRIRRYAVDAEVLNLFAYTGAFSVHAALGGAARVTSVDSARGALRWARANLVESGLDPDRHRWFPDDVATHLTRAVRRGTRYGVVILDPPAFGHAAGAVHALERDFGRLIESALRLLVPGGFLVVSTHLLALDALALRTLSASAAVRAERSIDVVEELGLPEWDHPAEMISGVRANALADRGSYLKTLVLRAG